MWLKTVRELEVFSEDIPWLFYGIIAEKSDPEV